MHNLVLLAATTLSLFSFADSPTAAFVGDSQSTAPYGFFEKTFGENGILHGQVHVNSGRAICGASIWAFTSRPMSSTCGFRLIKNGEGFGQMGSCSERQRNWFTRRGRDVPSQCNARGHSLVADTWLKGDEEWAIIQLAGNHHNNPEGAEKAARALTKKIKEHGKKCLWIGTPAPNYPENPNKCKERKARIKRITAAIKRGIAEHGCELVDSNQLLQGKKLTSYDCRHLNNSALKEWSKAVAEPIRQIVIVDSAETPPLPECNNCEDN